MQIKVGISNRHVHLTLEDYKILFNNTPILEQRDLSQIGEYASNLVVSIKGPKGIINNVRVVGPLRTYTQVEISKSDSYVLGVEPPVRSSGDLKNACEIVIINNNNSITRKCGIISERHIHISKEEQKKYNLYNDKYKVKINNIKGGILDNIKLKVSDKFNLELHIDHDDANAFLLKEQDEVELITKE